MTDAPESRWTRIKTIVADAIDLGPESRPAWIDGACAGDAILRGEVEALVRAHEQAGVFLEAPALAAPGAAERVFATTDAPAAEPPLPQRFGAYRVLGRLGRGGMGVVYLGARDDDRFDKRVAIKVVSADVVHPSVLRRFEDERRILAALDHPNIARLLDAGTTPGGQPYVVMEHVDGDSIDAFCEARRLGTGERLRLFTSVCSAVQYSHQHLVVHRDIKARNILVTADAVPKLLDFGIATLLEPGGTDGGATRTAFRMLTPESASPEQMRGEPVTVATDVYSLGVLLYRLLTGRSPYRGDMTSDAGIARAICEEEPARPSDVNGEDRRQLRGDLDVITLKALRKEPERRYASVEQLAQDVQRHLHRQPVLAAPDAWTYRARKFVARHWVGLGAAAAVALALAAGGGAAWWQAKRAERRFNDVRKLADFVMFDMHDAILKLPGSTPARKQLVEKAVEYLDRLAAEGGSDPDLLAEIARGYERLADVQGDPGGANLGDRAGAKASIAKAITLRERLAAAAPADRRAAARHAHALGVLALLQDAPDMRAPLDRMKAALESVPHQSPEDTAVLVAWGEYYSFLGGMQREAISLLVGEVARSPEVAALRESTRRQLEIYEELLARDPSRIQSQRNLALSYKRHGAALHRAKEWEAARVLYDKALALDAKGAEAEPANPHRKLDLSFSHGSIGSLLRDEGDQDGALAAYGSALKLREEVYAADPSNDFAFTGVVRAHESLVGVFANKGDLAAATVHAREMLKLRERWERTHPSLHGSAARQASFHWTTGDTHATIAALPATAAAGRREHWRRAREEYSRALALWLEIGRKKPLEGSAASNPGQLREAIARCDEAAREPAAPGRR